MVMGLGAWLRLWVVCWSFAEGEDGASRAYLLEGVVPEGGQLDVESLERTCDALSYEVASGALAPAAGAGAASRAVTVGLHAMGAALYNNVASRCGAIYGGDAACDRRETYAAAHAAAPGFVGVALNYAYFLEQSGDPAAAARTLAAAAAANDGDGDDEESDGLRIFAACLAAPAGIFQQRPRWCLCF